MVGADMFGFQPGDTVELRGLSKVELNGQRGAILPLEFPEQVAQLGRLAVMMASSGKRLSLKPENLVRVDRELEAKRSGGDLGEEWSAELSARGLAASLSLRRPTMCDPAAAQELTLLSLCLGLADEGVVETRLREIVTSSSGSLPDLVCVQEGLEGRDGVTALDYVKLVSSAVHAQPLREAVYGDRGTLGRLPEGDAERLLVNEVYLRDGCAWEVLETGVELISSDLTLSTEGRHVSGDGDGDAAEIATLAARSVVWVRLCPRSSTEGPFVFVMCAQLSGSAPREERCLLGSGLAGERRLQAERLLALFRARRASPEELGVLAVGPSAACGEAQLAAIGGEELQEQLRRRLAEPLELLEAERWGLRPEALEAVGAPVLAASRRAALLAADLSPLSGRSACGDEARQGWRARFRIAAGGADAEARPIAGLEALPILGLGTQFTPEDLKERVSDQDFRRLGDELTEDAVLAALRAGVRLFESGNKHVNQQAVGRTLQQAIKDGLVSRAELFVSGRICKCRDEAEVRREVDMLLRELRLDYVDLLVMDIPPERAPTAWPWAEALCREGRARFLGAANFDLLGPKVCTETFRDFIAGVRITPAVHAMEVHPFNTNVEMAECCRACEIRVLAYSPLGAPHKIEAFMENLTKSDARDMRPILKVPDNSVLQDVGGRHGAFPAQVALRWNLQRGHCVVPKSFNPEHIRENVELFHFSLSQKEMSILAGLHKGVRAERFFQQAYSQGRKALPRMTRDAQDACEAILAKIRGPGCGAGAGTAEEHMQVELAELYRRQEVLKGRGKGVSEP